MFRNTISAGILALASVIANAAAAEITTQLPRTVRPLHYDIVLDPHPENLHFDAQVNIDVDVLKPVRSITLNAADLQFKGASLEAMRATAPAVAAQKIVVDNAKQSASFFFSHAIAKGHYRLKIGYSGVIGTQATGLFAIDYDTDEGHRRALYTQFENSDARRMIPCWDEPEYKASFTLHADLPQGLMALSNMPVAAQTALPNGRKRVSFGESPTMSTYLLFFAEGEFERVTTEQDGTELGVVTRKGALPQASFALNASKDILREYNDYFGVRYPLPKLDNIAGPGSSEFFGAMENWGAIFTFEHSMLLDPEIATANDKIGIFETEAHEMAHQWFGDLVTMHWWDDLWLNEGFASWMERRTTARLHPEWHVELGAVDGREHAMEQDAMASTHPVVQHVATVEQASQAFDAITYSKGEAVIHMLENYVGPDAWRQGVRAYMRAHANGNTDSDDFWREIDRAAGKNVSAMAHDFTLQPGVPMIEVGEPVCRNGATTVALTQTEFSSDRPHKAALTWRVPVVASLVGSAQQVRLVVEGGKALLNLPGCGAVLINIGQGGYYRTRYAAQNFAALTAAFATLEPIDQLGLLSDSWSLGLAGKRPMSDFLDLAQAVPMNADPQVWAGIADKFTVVHQQYRGDLQRQSRFDQFAAARLTPKLEQVGWIAQTGESDDVAQLRQSLIATLGTLGDRATIAEARRRYAAQQVDKDALPVPLRAVVTEVVARHADAATWEALHATARAEKSPLIRDRMYRLLALSRDDALARRALQLAIGDEPGATNSAGMIAVVANEHAELAFDFALEHIDQVEHLVDANSMSRYFPQLADPSANPETITKLNAYAEAHLARSARHDVDMAAARIRDRIRIREQRLPAIDAWLTAQHG